MKKLLPTYRCHTSSLQERRVIFFGKNSGPEAVDKPQESGESQEKGKEKKMVDPKRETEERVVRAESTARRTERKLKGKVSPEKSPQVNRASETSDTTTRPTQQERPQAQPTSSEVEGKTRESGNRSWDRSLSLQEGRTLSGAEHMAVEDLMIELGRSPEKTSQAHLERLQRRLPFYETIAQGPSRNRSELQYNNAKAMFMREAIRMQEEIMETYARVVDPSNPAYSLQMGLIRAMPDGKIYVESVRRTGRRAPEMGSLFEDDGQDWASIVLHTFGKTPISFEEFRTLQPRRSVDDSPSLFQRGMQVEYHYRASVLVSIRSKANNTQVFGPYREELQNLEKRIQNLWSAAKSRKEPLARVQAMELIVYGKTKDTNDPLSTGEGDLNLVDALQGITAQASARSNAETEAAIARCNRFADCLEGALDVAYGVGSSLTQLVAGPVGPVASSVAYNLYKLHLGLLEQDWCAINITLDSVLAFVPVGPLAKKLGLDKLWNAIKTKPIIKECYEYVFTTVAKVRGGSLAKEDLKQTTETLAHFLLKKLSQGGVKKIISDELGTQLGIK
ncbi:hypothetical protein A2635_04945 [Candidatus Peribacteria bacterium RIFCSPHIGHO2_01_FULL_51_9]|nr:MAG: hypothetical protein A2635_04945 [Candidatus Peribacteria bacterium RIFCSPHIGHO2_01_FULL_51_9]